MKRIVVPALLLGLMTSAATAESWPTQGEPRPMTESEMGQTVGGLVDIGVLVPVNVVTNAALAAAVGVLAKDIQAGAPAVSDVDGAAVLDQSSFDFDLK